MNRTAVENTSSWLSPENLTLLNLIIAGSLFSLGYFLVNLWGIGLLIIVLAIFWYIAKIRSWNWVPSTVFTLYVAATAAGFLLGISPPLLIIGMLFAVFAWDLDAFTRRLNRTANFLNIDELISGHILRLFLFESLALVVTILALTVRLEMGFGILMLLGLLVVGGLSYAINYLLKTNN